MAHLGQNIARLRGMRRMTQKEMAAKLQLAQPEYSRIEQKEHIDDNLIERIAQALEVSQEIIKEFKEDTVFTNNVYEQNNTISQIYFQTNPLDKIVELYERLLESEREKNDLLEEKLQNTGKAK